MEYNIDILLAGCSTNCRHCYVNGGPAKSMEQSDAELCFDRLIPVFQHFGKEVSFTLDNEAYLYPELPTLFQRIRENCFENYAHHGSTTGIAFNHRQDKEELWKLQAEMGLAYGCITFHGGRDNHNFITRNPHSFEELVTYGHFVKTHGGQLSVNLILSKFLIADREELTCVLKELQPGEVFLSVPNCAPNKRLFDYQQWRANIDDCELLTGYLSAWGIPEAEKMDKLRAGTHEALLKKYFAEGMPAEPEQAFLTVHRDLSLWYGNTGVEQTLWGDLRDLSSQTIISLMEACKPTWNFYPHAFKTPPELSRVAAYAANCKDQSLVYSDLDSLLSRMVQEMERRNS